MALFDMPIEELIVYKPPRQEPKDFDDFWQESIDLTRRYPLNPQFQLVNVGLKTVDTFDVTFSGYGGQSIKGWLLLPHHRTGKLPCVVEFTGYGSGRGFPTDWLLWSSVGFGHLIMDTRGQGSTGRKGDTPDIIIDGANPFHPGFMTQGILDPKNYYYRRVFMDGVRAVEVACHHPSIDADRIAVTGISQGGGISIAISGLMPDVVRVSMPDVPFLCHYRRATQLTDAGPYGEISRYCQVHRDKVEQVFDNLSYFDSIHFATRAKAQALFSVALMDEVCPPSTVFAAYNHYDGMKDIRVWSYNHHEGGNNFQIQEQVKFLTSIWC